MKEVLIMVNKNIRDPYIILFLNSIFKTNYKIILPKEFPSFLPFFKICRSAKSDLIHIQWIHLFTGARVRNPLIKLLRLLNFIIDVYLIKYLLQKKIVWTIHNLHTHEYTNLFLDKISRKFLSKKANAVICHGKSAKKEIIKEYKLTSKKIHTITYGNQFDVYKNEISKENARKILNLNRDDLVFCFFGRIRPYKGLDELINNFKALKKSNNIKLLIVGNPLNNGIKRHLINISKGEKTIIFKFGFIPYNDVQIYLNASDILVTSFKTILTSGIVISGMTFGKPIIAPRLGCIIDYLDDNGAFLYNPQEKNGLLKALQKALKNKEFLPKMGNYNFTLAEKLDWKVVGKEIVKIYDYFT